MRFKLLLLLLIPFFSIAQSPEFYPAGELQHKLKKLQVLASVLYMAAHPDDENTAMISYLANDRLARTGYLALTRGDGGQNLIGPEQRELMGLIRTHELLQARNTDGGEQFFTRANDFGYSKNPEEAFSIWERDKILADAVWAIRKFRPDVIITRFPPTSAAGHGHHTASAILAAEAFDLINDPNYQITTEDLIDPDGMTWQPKRVLWNCYSRINGRFTNQPPDSLKGVSVTTKLSSYNPLLGKSHTVIAAESRSMHKSQGFGASRNRDERIDYLAHVKGDLATEDLFDGIDLTWNRIAGGSEVDALLKEAYAQFNPENPSEIVPILLKVRKKLVALSTLRSSGEIDKDTEYWATIKLRDLDDVILGCLGLWLEATGTEFSATNGDSVQIAVEALNRSDISVELKEVNFHFLHKDFSYTPDGTPLRNPVTFENDSLPRVLENEKMLLTYFSFPIPDDTPISQPYWLIEKPTKGVYQVENQNLIGLPENPPAVEAMFHLKINGEEVIISKPVEYKWRKADEGELYRDFIITPKVMVNVQEKVYMFSSEEAQTISLTLKSGSINQSGSVSLDLPDTWQVEPSSQDFNLENKDQEITLDFQVFPPTQAEESILKVQLNLEGQNKLARGFQTIEYAHLPILTVFPEAEAKLVRLDLQTGGKKIGYIEGAGDDIPRSLRQVGYDVTILTEKELQEDLSVYDAIAVGVRAFNLQEGRLAYYHQKLLDYVEQGGVLVMQYHTPWRMQVENLGPYPFQISRGRVTVEEAPINFVNKKHPLLNTPNEITEADFEDWVQERGLYFSDEWDEHYETVLSSKDPNEESDLEGGLLYTKFGEGIFIYTGYSFFRELPAGVAGAYRLFANLLAKP